MSRLIDLIHCNFDVFHLLVKEWIEFRDIIRLDTALTNHELRNYFFPLLRNVPYRLASRTKWTIEQSLHWFIRRQMYNLMNEIDVNPTSWHQVVHHPQLHRSQFLSGVKQLVLRYRNNQHSYPYLSECHNVQRVTMYYISNGLTLPPNLQEIRLFQCTMNQDFVQSFDQCQQLSHLHCESTVFLSISPQLTYSFFSRLKSLTIEGKVFSFFRHWLFTKNRIEYLKLDNLFGAQTVENPFPQFFQACEALHCLELHRFSWIYLYDLFQAISQSGNHSLKSLKLSNIGIDQFDQDFLIEDEEAERRMENQNMPIQTLVLERLLYLNDGYKLEIILRLTRRSLRSLTIIGIYQGFCLEDLEQILIYCPFLQELTISAPFHKDQEEYLQNMFESIPSFQLLPWPS